jgi:hypothetical protein
MGQRWLWMPALAQFIFLTLSPHIVKLPVNWVSAKWDSTSTESMQNETPHQLSQRRMRLHTNWVNAEWDSTLTESMQNETPHQLSQCGMRKYLQGFHHSAMIQLMWSRTPRLLVNMESHSALTQLTRNMLCVESVRGRWSKPIQATCENPYQLSQRGMSLYLRRFHHSAISQLTWSFTQYCFRWLRISLGVDSVCE